MGLNLRLIVYAQCLSGYLFLHARVPLNGSTWASFLARPHNLRAGNNYEEYLRETELDFMADCANNEQ